MSSSVCQITKTTHEPSTGEPRVLRLKLAPPNSGGLSFLQCLDGPTPQNYQNATAGAYVHPLAKRSASRLSERSLAMCTESLGSETGSDVISPLSPESDVINIRRAGVSRVRRLKKQSRDDVAFPPPLTSLGGSGGVRVSPRREDGRLILTAVSVSPASSNFHSERSNGRLRIRLVAQRSRDSASEQEAEEADREVWSGGQNGKNGKNIGGENRINGFLRGRSRRCQGMRAWEQELGEPFWVAT